MGKKYNYFDDEPVTKSRASNRNSASSSRTQRGAGRKKAPKDAKEILSTTLVMAKLGSRQAEKAVKSVARKARRSKVARVAKEAPRKHSWFGVVFILTITILAIIITVFGAMNTMHKENKRESEFNSAAADVCLKYEDLYGVCNYENMSQYNVSGYRMTGLCYAREIDFDSDNRSELLLCYNTSGGYVVEVWGFDGGDFVQLYHGSAVQTKDVKDPAWFTIYSKNSKYYLCEHNEEDITDVTLLALHGDGFSKKTTCTYVPDTDEYVIKGQADPMSFDVVRLSVLREIVVSNQTEKTIDIVDSFTGGKRVNQMGSNQTDMMNREYYSIIQDYQTKYGVGEFKESKGKAYMSGVGYVDVLDFNNDGVNELMIVYRRPVNVRQENYSGSYVAVTVDKYFCDIFSWNGSNAWRVFTSEGISNSLNDDKDNYIMLKVDGKKPQLCLNQFSSSSYGKVINASSKMLAFDGEKFEPSFKASYEKEYGYTTYYIDGDETYHSSFESKGGYSVPMFDGSTTYDSSKYTVIYLQCDDGNASRIKSVPGMTTQNIQKINPSYQG